MKRVFAFFLLVVFLTGCAGKTSEMDQAVAVRKQLLDASGCVFSAQITADYLDAVYLFSMKCTVDSAGALAFTVTSPESIAGISGRMDSRDSALTFDDVTLGFAPIAGGMLTPVSAPWHFINSLKSGFIRDCYKGKSGLELTVDDHYSDGQLRLLIRLDQENLPAECEIYWNGSRILLLHIIDFVYL